MKSKKFFFLQPPLLGLEEFVHVSHVDREKTPKPQDPHNLRLLKGLHPADEFGMPQISSHTPSRISYPLAFNEARAIWNKYGSLQGYFVHFFIEDSHFECVRKSPEKYLCMFLSADFIIATDYSTYRNYPFPILMKNAFDNLLLAAYYERNGVKVVANVIWALPLFYDFTFSGQPIGGCICVSSNSVAMRDKKGIQLWLHGYKEAIKRLRPKVVIRFGKIIPGEGNVYATPIPIEENNHFVKAMRYGR